jgi:hypothetical protein
MLICFAGINPYKTVSTKEIALTLDQIGCPAPLAHGVEVGQGGRECGHWQTLKGS